MDSLTFKIHYMTNFILNQQNSLTDDDNSVILYFLSKILLVEWLHSAVQTAVLILQETKFTVKHFIQRDSSVECHGFTGLGTVFPYHKTQSYD